MQQDVYIGCCQMKNKNNICKFTYTDIDHFGSYMCPIVGTYCKLNQIINREDIVWNACPFSKVVTFERWKKYQEDKTQRIRE